MSQLSLPQNMDTGSDDSDLAGVLANGAVLAAGFASSPEDSYSEDSSDELSVLAFLDLPLAAASALRFGAAGLASSSSSDDSSSELDSAAARKREY